MMDSKASPLGNQGALADSDEQPLRLHITLNDHHSGYGYHVAYHGHSSDYYP